MILIHGSSSTRSDQGSPRRQRGPLDFACKIFFSGFQAMSLPAWDNTYDDDELMNPTPRIPNSYYYYYYYSSVTKASSGDISGTKRGIIDPLVSKQPENSD